MTDTATLEGSVKGVQHDQLSVSGGMRRRQASFVDSFRNLWFRNEDVSRPR